MTTRPITSRMPEETYQKLKYRAAREQTTVSEYILGAVQKRIEEDEKLDLELKRGPKIPIPWMMGWPGQDDGK